MQLQRCDDTSKHLRTTVTKLMTKHHPPDQMQFVEKALIDCARQLVLHQGEAASRLITLDGEDAPVYYLLLTASGPKQLANRKNAIRNYFQKAICGQLLDKSR